ncbi:GTP-binding protein [Halioxenophilus sp. WMMB6]|uniref:GTP-binding protein n=1 Tax=Halioxenophilus sp. WMMB6 TaxID=3073815 RepID=UPI00295E3979|nr:ATP/GTP-binding protein [Halioxenophilus sp. WMMB6]
MITGTAAVGKTTAIQSISDRPPVTTDQAATDGLAIVKDTTTVAFDFGEIVLPDETIVRVYGTPGQERFRHMWEIIAEGALGFIILVDASRDEPVVDLDMYLANFQKNIAESSAVVGVTRSEQNPNVMNEIYQYLENQQLIYPVMAVDPREKTDMKQLLLSLIAMLECY